MVLHTADKRSRTSGLGKYEPSNDCCTVICRTMRFSELMPALGFVQGIWTVRGLAIRAVAVIHGISRSAWSFGGVAEREVLAE